MNKDRVIEQLRQENQALHKTVQLLNSRLGAITGDTAPGHKKTHPAGRLEAQGKEEKKRDPRGERSHRQNVQQLVRVCCELQQIQGNDPFWLSCRHAGAILGVSHAQTAKYIHELVLNGVLQVIEVHKSNRATRYRYVEKSLTEPCLV